MWKGFKFGLDAVGQISAAVAMLARLPGSGSSYVYYGTFLSRYRLPTTAVAVISILRPSASSSFTTTVARTGYGRAKNSA